MLNLKNMMDHNSRLSDQCRQKSGVNNTRIVKTSKRPKSIAKFKSQWAEAGNVA